MKTAHGWWGESRIFQCKQEQDCRIRRVNLLPSRPKALPEAVEAIREAEMVVLAPGEPVYQHHPQPAGGWHRGGHPGVPCPENLRL